MTFLDEWALIEELNKFRKAEAEAYDEPYDDGYMGNAGSERGTTTRTTEANVPYYPSASKGDVMASGAELQGLFGINYVDERN